MPKKEVQAQIISLPQPMLLQLTSPLSTALLELVNQLKLREIEFESGTEIVNLLQQQKGKSKENGLVASVSTVDHQLLVDLVKHCRQNVSYAIRVDQGSS